MEVNSLGKNLGVANVKTMASEFKGKKLLGKLWVVFSIPFVAFSLWQMVEREFYHRGVQNGSKRAAELIYSDIIAKANNQECKTIFVEQSGRKVDLINIKCLQIKGKPQTKASVAQSKKTRSGKNRVN